MSSYGSPEHSGGGGGGGVTQLWKQNDYIAQKTGACQTVYWVKELSDTVELKTNIGQRNQKKWVTGTTYKGEWENNMKHGYGIQIWSNGNKYEGEWKNNFRDGHGTLWIKQKKQKQNNNNASKFVLNSKEKNKSIMNDTSDLIRVYTGNWLEDNKHGMGIYYYLDGSRYEGNWVNNVRSGQGIYYYNNGDIYNGEWHNDKQNGFGTLTKKNNDIYEGQFINGLREGSGIYYYKSKEKMYDGEWVNDQPKCGVYIDAKNFFNDSQEQKTYLFTQSVNNINSIQSIRYPINNNNTVIPRLRVKNSDTILAKQIESIQINRSAVRNLPYTNLIQLFDNETLNDIQFHFNQADINKQNAININELQTLLQNTTKLTPNVTELEVNQIKNDVDLRKKETFHLQHFIQAVYLIQQLRIAQQIQVETINNNNNDNANTYEEVNEENADCNSVNTGTNTENVSTINTGRNIDEFEDDS